MKTQGLLTLKLLQGLTSGHELQIQEYMSDMGIVKEVMNLAEQMQEMKALENVLDVQTSCFHTLEAFCEGPCGHNQEFLVKHGATNMSNMVLSSCLRRVDTSEARAGWGRLMKSVLQLLKVRRTPVPSVGMML